MDQVVSLAEVFLDVTQRCVTSKKTAATETMDPEDCNNKKKKKTKQNKKPYPLKILT